MKFFFLTFADSRMHRALTRISAQAAQMNVYDCIVAANESNLDIRFRQKYRETLVQGSRGYGYWIWKAQIIHQTLMQMEEGDVLQYIDVGFHLNPNGRARLHEYIALAEKSDVGILGFQAVPPSFHNSKVTLPDLRESKWCKGDLFDYFGVYGNPEIMDTQTIGSGNIFIRKCKKSVKLVNDWLDVYAESTHLIDDTPSKIKNSEGFIDHRHDQSIFSILGKLNGIATVSAYEYWYPMTRVPLLPDWGILRKYPFHAKRDKGVHWLKKPVALVLRILKRIQFEIKRRAV